MGEVIQFKPRKSSDSLPDSVRYGWGAIQAFIEQYVEWGAWEARAEALADVEEFGRRHKHFEARRHRMANLIASGRAKTLRGAYILAGKESA